MKRKCGGAMIKNTFLYAVIIFLITTLTSGCGSTPQITIENIQTAIIGKNTNEGLMSWTFRKDEPKNITIIESKYDGAKATIIINMITKADQETMDWLGRSVIKSIYMSGKLRLECEYIAKEWNIISVENLSFKQVALSELLENIHFDKKEIENIIQKHIKNAYASIKLGIQDEKDYIKKYEKALTIYQDEGLINILPNFEIVSTEKGKTYPNIIQDNVLYILLQERTVKGIISVDQKENVFEVYFNYIMIPNDLGKKLDLAKGSDQIQQEFKATSVLEYDIFTKKLFFKGYNAFNDKTQKWVAGGTWIDDDNTVKWGMNR